MAKVIMRQEAIDDLNDIWNYTFEEWSEKQADHITKPLNLLVSQLEKNLILGKIILKYLKIY